MQRASITLFLAILVCLAALGTGLSFAVAATYYVSPKGDNANPGTKEKPWATPGYGSRQLKAGDILIISGGKYILSVYDDDIIKPTQSGTAAAWITIKGEEGNRPVLAGRNDLYAAALLGGINYLRLENLEITHDPTATGKHRWFRTGIDISETPASHIELKDLYIHHLDEGALNIQDVNDIKAINCRFEYCGFGGILGPAAGPGGGVRHLLVKGCRLSYSGHYYQGTAGPSIYDRPDGLGLEESAGPIEIADTVVEHNRGDGLDSKIANTYIHNCIVANNSCDGIKLWQDGSKIENCLIYGTGDGKGGRSDWAGIVIDSEASKARFEIVNVTLHDNPARQAYPMYVQYGYSTPISLVLRNSIFANGYGTVYLGPSVALTADHNLFYRPGQTEQVEARGRVFTVAEIEKGLLGPGNLSRPPKFVRPAWGKPGDYHLLPGSAGIDRGTARGAPAFDLDHRPRPQGRRFDMGAYETSP